MYIFKLFDIDSNEHNSVTFQHKPSKMEIVDLLWYADCRQQQGSLNQLMEATGDDIYFDTVDEDGLDNEEYEIFSDGIYASLTFVPE